MKGVNHKPHQAGGIKSMNRKEKIQLLSIIVLVGFVCAVAYHYVLGVYWKMPYPYNTFLFRPDDRFNDFRNLYNQIVQPDAPNLLSHNASRWFQILYVIPAFFALFGLSADLATALYLLCFVLAFLWIYRLNLGESTALESWRNVLLCAVVSYPFLITLDRANLEGVVFLLVFLFVRAVQRERYNSAMVWLGLAVASKPFPVVFVILLLLKKRFREAVGAGVICLMVSAIACYVRYGTFSPQNAEGLSSYQMTYAIGNEGLYFGHSLWGVAKMAALGFSHVAQCPADIPDLALVYFGFTTAFFLVMVWWMWQRKPLFWQQVALLVCAMNLLPFVSGDYKLLYLSVPLLLFINEPCGGRRDGVYCCLFGLLLVPKAYGHVPRFLEASFGIIINPILMMCLVAVILRDPRNQLASRPTP